MKKISYLKLLKIFVVILTISAFAGLFMPYEKSIGEYREDLLKNPETINVEEVNFKNSDVVDISIMENFNIYRYGVNNSNANNWVYGESLINIIITVFLIFSIVLVLLFTILNKKIAVIVFDVFLGLSSLAMNYDIVDRGVIPSSKYTYGISYYLYIVIATLILISTIATIILKKDNNFVEKKKKQKLDTQTTKTREKKKVIEEKKKADVVYGKFIEKKKLIVSKLLYSKKYIIYIIVIIIVLAIGTTLLLNNKLAVNRDKNEIEDYDKNISDKTESNDNSEVNVEFSNRESNIEYNFVKAASGDYVIIGKNRNDGINNIEIEFEFYNKEDELIGTGNASLSAVSKNTEFAVDLYDAPKSYDYYKAFIDVGETDNKSYADNLKVNSTNNGEEIVVQSKNTTKDEIEFVSVSIVYYKGNTVVGYDNSLQADVKTERSANFKFSFPYDENYDTLEFDTYKIFINSAYSYTW